jgi:hypothetical protein
MPTKPVGESVICGFVQAEERLFVCDNLGEMMELYQQYEKGIALQLNWYTARVPDLYALAQGNQGARSVLTQLQELPDGEDLMQGAKVMNLVGPGVWIGFKGHCKEDLGAFAAAIRSRDTGMVETINNGLRGDGITDPGKLATTGEGIAGLGG